jgi:hypothetical protein
MNKYRKKPVVIEAVRYRPGQNCDEVHDWLGIHHSEEDCFDDASLMIPTLEGEMEAEPGDWIIKGVKGEFYPCQPDIFEATYEAA